MLYRGQNTLMSPKNGTYGKSVLSFGTSVPRRLLERMIYLSIIKRGLRATHEDLYPRITVPAPLPLRLACPLHNIYVTYYCVDATPGDVSTTPARIQVLSVLAIRKTDIKNDAFSANNVSVTRTDPRVNYISPPLVWTVESEKSNFENT